ncbi:hypothetical protein MTR67_001855 [Solanum verrucosum]|uniref:Uncharacterized protein n=1 Tax=Solanum verrucosum TaxID=315347 RepID=A0AAF0TCS1_SOLVR|nr:hypothetical protein MTR67_001855 [Solanum verrucosum]
MLIGLYQSPFFLAKTLINCLAFYEEGGSLMEN